ncbi:MAG: AsmA-like C-terminal region-containing protein [Balneolaceae bacterium]
MKFLKILVGVLFFLLVLILVLPYAFRGKITELAKKEINESVNAKVDFSNVSLSLIRSFPNFSLRLDDLSVLGNAPFENDTLFYTQHLDITLDLMTVFKGDEYVIKEIGVRKPYVQLITLDDGRTNWEIIPLSGDSEVEEIPGEDSGEADAFQIMLKSFSIQDGRMVYIDNSLPFHLSMDKINTNLSGDLSLDQTQMFASLDVGNITSTYDGMTMTEALSLETDISIDANLADYIFDVHTDNLLLNSLPLSMGGRFSLADTHIGIDFKFDAPQGTFKQLLSLVPSNYLKDYSKLTTTGGFSFNAFAKGNFSENEFPAFGAELKVERGTIAYTDLPERLDNIQLALFVDNKTGDFDDTFVDIKPLKFSMKDNPFELNLSVRRPMSDPEIDASMKGRLILEEISALIPDSEIPAISGTLDLDMALKTSVSTIEEERYEQVDASGSAILSEFRTQVLEEWDEDLTIQKAELKISPRAINTDVRSLKIGKSDFNFSGDVQDYLGYFLSDGVLKGQFKLTSQNMDASELMEHFATDTTDTTALDLGLFDRMDLKFASTIHQLKYEQYELKEVRAGINIVDNKIQLDPLEAKLLGGQVKMSGELDVIDKHSPLFNFDFSISKFDIPTTYKTINLFQAVAPIAENMTGKFSVDFNLKGRIDEELQPIYSSLQGGGDLTTSKIEVESVPALNQLASLLGNEDYRKLTADVVDIGFEFVNGRVYQKPFGLNLASSNITMSGSLGFDQTLDYSLLMNVPFGKLGKTVSDGIVNLVSSVGGKKANLKPNTEVQIKAKISGLVTSPKVSIDYKDYASNVKADLNRLAQQELEKQKEALKEKAKAEAEKLINEAREQGDKLIAQADATAKSIREEANKAAASLREEADKKADQLIAEGKKKGIIGERLAVEAAKKIREEADTKASGLECKADQNALKIQTEARNKADALVQAAERKAGS